MPAYNQGGGGGRASSTTTEDQFAYDQPFEIGSSFTAETAQQINDMFAILFKAVSRAQTSINAVTLTGGDIFTVRREIAEAELEVLNSSPLVIIAAVPEKIIIPLFMSIKVVVTTGYSSNPVWSLRYSGITQNITNTSDTAFTVTGTKYRFQSMIDGATGLTSDGSNTDVVVFLNGNPGTPATGVATATVSVAYVLVDSTL